MWINVNNILNVKKYIIIINIFIMSEIICIINSIIYIYIFIKNIKYFENILLMKIKENIVE